MYYLLSRPVEMQSVTTKAKLSSCERLSSSSSSSSCSGYELDPRHPCETYSVFGRRPSVDTTGRSIVCVTGGRLVSALGVNVQLDQLSSLFVDKSVKSVSHSLSNSSLLRSFCCSLAASSVMEQSWTRVGPTHRSGRVGSGQVLSGHEIYTI